MSGAADPTPHAESEPHVVSMANKKRGITDTIHSQTPPHPDPTSPRPHSPKYSKTMKFILTPTLPPLLLTIIIIILQLLSLSRIQVQVQV